MPQVYHADGQQVDTSNLYTVIPEGGVIEAGQSANITVKFSPLEVDDSTRYAVQGTCHIDVCSCILN